MIGGCGISAFPMSSRVVQRLAAEEEPGISFSCRQPEPMYPDRWPL